MSFKIIPSNTFLKQLKKINPKNRKLIEDKIELIKENPFRYKKIHSKDFSKVFRIRFSLDKKETRLSYTIVEPNIILVCLLNRKKDYKDLEKYLRELKKK